MEQSVQQFRWRMKHTLVLAVAAVLLALGSFWMVRADAQCAPSDLTCKNFK